MDFVNSVLPHLVWATCVVLVAFRVVARLGDEARLKELAYKLDTTVLKLTGANNTIDALITDANKLKSRLDKLEATSISRKVTF